MTADALSIQDIEARIGRLTQALLHVASELWATRDRQWVLEHLLAEHGISAPTAIDNHSPEEALAAKLTAERESFIAGILTYLAPGD